MFISRPETQTVFIDRIDYFKTEARYCRKAIEGIADVLLLEVNSNTEDGEGPECSALQEEYETRVGLILALQLLMRERERIDQRAAETMRELYDALNERPSMRAVGE